MPLEKSAEQLESIRVAAIIVYIKYDDPTLREAELDDGYVIRSFEWDLSPQVCVQCHIHQYY